MEIEYSQSKRPMIVEDLLKIKTLEDPQISPDGTKVAFTVQTMDAENNKYRNDIWVVNAGGACKLVNITRDGTSRMPRWAPNSRDLTYISTKERKQTICITNYKSEYKTTLTDFSVGTISLGRIGETLAWSPDGSTIAYIASAEPAPKKTSIRVITKMNYRAPTGYADMQRRHIFLVSPLGHSPPEQITFGDYDEHSICWSPNSKEVCFVSNRTPEGREGYNYHTVLWAVDVDSKEIRRITQTVRAVYQPDWSPDGKKITYAAMKRDNTNNDSNPEDQHVWVISSEGEEELDLAVKLDRRCGDPKWTPDGKWILFSAEDHGRKNLYQVSPEGGPVTVILDGDRYIESDKCAISVAKKCGKIAYIPCDPTHLGEIYVANIDGSDEKKLTDFNEPLLEEVHLSKPVEFNYTSFDGTKVQGWLMKPPSFNPSKKYPFLLHVHGGPHAMYGYLFYDYFQVLTANNYVIAHINCRGSTGYGQKFSDGCVLDLGGGDYKDYMTGVDYLLSKYDFLDEERMGVWGLSYGGFMTNWIITHTDRFKAAVSICCISNQLSMYPCNAPSWSDSEFGGGPWDKMDLYLERSPIMYAKNGKTPTLFLHGLHDSICPPWQAEEMFMALKHMKVDTAMVLYEGSGHSIDSCPEHYLDTRKRMVAWFDKYLKG